MDPKGTTLLADFSRQVLRVGNPPVFTFTEQGHRVDRELVALSAQLRIAEALERIATAMEAKPELLHTNNILVDIQRAANLELSPEEHLELEKEMKGGSQS